MQQRRETKQGQRLITRPFTGKVLSMMNAAVPFNQHHPSSSEPFEVGGLRRINGVLHDAGDHTV